MSGIVQLIVAFSLIWFCFCLAGVVIVLDDIKDVLQEIARKMK